MIALSRLSTAAGTAAPPLNRLFKLTLGRVHGSVPLTALPQLNPDYHYDYNSDQGEMEQGHKRLYAVPEADTEGSETRRGVQWAFIGNPRAKKHVYAEMLSRLLEVPHISMASLVRQDLNPRSSLYKKIANAVNGGEIVTEDTIFGLLSKRLEDGYCRGEMGFILDGIPRTRLQAEILDQLAEIDLVVNFKCTEDLVVKNRVATAESSLKEKLRAYAEQNKPLEEFYRKQKKLLEFQVGKAPLETWQGLLTALRLQHTNDAHSAQKVITESNLL